MFKIFLNQWTILYYIKNENIFEVCSAFMLVVIKLLASVLAQHVTNEDLVFNQGHHRTNY